MYKRRIAVLSQFFGWIQFQCFPSFKYLLEFTFYFDNQTLYLFSDTISQPTYLFLLTDKTDILLTPMKGDRNSIRGDLLGVHYNIEFSNYGVFFFLLMIDPKVIWRHLIGGAMTDELDALANKTVEHWSQLSDRELRSAIVCYCCERCTATGHSQLQENYSFNTSWNIKIQCYII